MAEGDLKNYDIGKPRQISSRETDKVRETLREFSQFQLWRNTHAQQWEETAELILPTSRNTFFYGNFNWPGQKKTDRQVDSTGALALHRFCAIADSLVTPRNQKYDGLRAGGRNADYVMKDRASRLWFENTARKLFQLRYAAVSGFSGQNYNNWQSVGAFGNATMYVDKFDGRNYGGARGLRYHACPLGETFFGQNHQGKVDRMIRWFRRTPYQAVQKWGMEWLPATLRAPLEQDSQWPYNFLHCVKPRGDDFDADRLDEKSLPFESYYVSIEGHCLMAPESGYRVFPYSPRRYDQTPNEVYGRGPAQIVLPALKTLNAQKRDFLTQGHRAAAPVLLTADDGIVGMDMRPGAMNKGGVTPDGKPLVHVLPSGNIQVSEKMMAEERGIIDDTFLVSLFKVLTEHPNMTATQVIELVNEKGMLVAPTLGRQHSDHAQMVERELDLMTEMRMLDPMPPRLREAKGEYEVVDTSPLALAARAGEAAGFIRMLESVKELVNITQDMSLLDPFDFDTAIPEIAEIQNVPVRWMANSQAVAAKRQNRAKQQAAQQKIQAMPAQAAMLKAQATVAKAQPGIAQGQAFGGPQQVAA
jgi:Bacteriophage head to tail connecting protein